MLKKAAVHICFAAALFAYAQSLSGGYWISIIVLASFLILSSLVLFFHGITSAHLWVKVVDTFNRVEVNYTITGFGLVLAGCSLIKPVWFPLGMLFIVAGALTILVGLGTLIMKIPLVRKILFKRCPVIIRICIVRVMGLRGQFKFCEKRCLCRYSCYTLSDKKAT